MRPASEWRCFITTAVLATALMASPVQAAAASDVLARCTQLVSSEGSAASSTTATFVTIADTQLPEDISKALTTYSLQWSRMNDVMRVGTLYAYGYVLAGSSGAQELATVYTDCSSDVTATRESTGGIAMKDIALSDAGFTATKCSANTCGTFSQADNTKCSTSFTESLRCAIKSVSTTNSTGSFWSSASADSVPYPQTFTHAIATGNGTKTIWSIHMTKEVAASTACGNSGDAIIPCIAYDDMGVRKFCRPQIPTSDVETFFTAVSKRLAPTTPTTPTPTTTPTTDSSSGLSLGGIIGIAIGVVAVVGILAFVLMRRKKGGRDHKDDSGYVRDRKSSMTAAQSSIGRRTTHGNNGSSTGVPRGQARGNNGVVRERDGMFATTEPPIMDGDDGSFMGTELYPNTGLTGTNTHGTGVHGLTSSQTFFTTSMTSSSSSTRSDARARLLGKTIEEYCDESDQIQDFLSDTQIYMKRISYDEITYLRMLSKGSYGEVWLGQLETRHVAIKRLLPEKCHLTRSIEQFAAEIRLMSTLAHPNIVSFIGVSWNQQLQNICVVVEYMESGDLSEVLGRQRDKLTWANDKIKIAMDVAEGLVYLHSMRPVVVHRDLKSKNVLLNKKGQAKLSDFGVSRKATVNETMTSGVGTLLWTAPEIIEGRKYSEKADIFSLGVVLSEIDTCEEPYATVKTDAGERVPGMQLVQMVRLGKIKVGFRDDCPPKLRELAEQCTSLDPDVRPSSMEVAYTLKSIIAPLLRNGGEDGVKVE